MNVTVSFMLGKELFKILSCALYRAVHGLRVFVNRMLRRIFGFKREVTGGCRTLHNEELHNLYSADIVSERYGKCMQSIDQET
jgi:hypothetical protein